MAINGQQMLHNTNKNNNGKRHKAGSITVITGCSGMGKTTLVDTILDSFGAPIIKHSVFHGTPFPESQIVYLKRNVPSHSSAKSLCQTICHEADEMLGTDLYRNAVKRISIDPTRTTYEDIMELIARSNHVGMLVIDEFQNISHAKSGGTKEILAMLINLRDRLNMPIVLVGTYKATRIFNDDMSTANRLTDGGGYFELIRPERPSNENWQNLMKMIWNYQWIKKPTPLSDEIIETLYDLSQGITGIAINLFIAAQVRAIESGTETISAELMKQLYESRFKPLHGAMNCLRSKDPNKLMAYDDLYFQGKNMLETNVVSNDLNELAERIKRQMATSGAQ